MAASQDHYCQCEIEEMTVVRNVGFSMQAVTSLVFVTLNEFGVVWSECVCVCVRRKWNGVQPQDWSERLTSLISFFHTHLFCCLMNQQTCFIWVMSLSYGEEVKTSSWICDHSCGLCSTQAAQLASLWFMYLCCWKKENSDSDFCQSRTLTLIHPQRAHFHSQFKV